jgi:chromosomal replication initiation ATPase DnaA
MDTLDEEIVFVVKRLANALNKHGVKRVVAVLDKLNNEEAFIEAHRELISYILNTTAIKFKVNPEDLKKSNVRGMTINARNMCCVLLKKHMELKHADISRLFGSDSHSIVSSAIKQFENLKYDVKADRIIIDIFKDVDEKVGKRKDMLWLKHS